MPNSISGSNAIYRTYHVTTPLPQNMNSAELIAAINDGNADAQRFAIQQIMSGNAHTTDEIVLSALEGCTPALDMATQQEIMATQSEEMLQILHHNPRLMPILERFFANILTRAYEAASITFRISLSNLQQTLNQEGPTTTATLRTPTGHDFVDGEITTPTLVPPEPQNPILNACLHQLTQLQQQAFEPQNFYASICQLHRASETAALNESITPYEYQRISRIINICLAYAKINHGFFSQ